MAWRYAAVFFLVVLLLGILGLVFGFLSLNTSAPLDRQLTAAGALAAYWGCSYDNCEWVEEEDPPSMYDGSDGASLEFVEEEWWWGNELPPPEDDTVDEFYFDDWRGADVGGSADEWIEWEEWDVWEAPREDSHWWGEEVWTVEDAYWVDQGAQKVQNPWYVSAFPGIGQVVQQIIPGQSVSVRAPSLPPPPRPVYPQPSCWIAAEPMNVSYGGATMISWASFNATRAILTDAGSVALSGSRLVQNIRSDRTYQLTVSGIGGSGNCHTRITVGVGSGTPSCIISAYPSAIHLGESSSLAWGSDHAVSAFLSGIGTVQPQGGMFVSPRQTIAYTLTVLGPQGASGSCGTQVGVLP